MEYWAWTYQETNAPIVERLLTLYYHASLCQLLWLYTISAFFSSYFIHPVSFSNRAPLWCVYIHRKIEKQVKLILKLVHKIKEYVSQLPLQSLMTSRIRKTNCKYEILQERNKKFKRQGLDENSMRITLGFIQFHSKALSANIRGEWR